MTWPPLTGRPFSSVRCRGRRGGANVPGMQTALFLVLYLSGTLAAVLPAPADCDQAAARETAAFAARGDPQFTVRCERLGPESMVWKLHPELAVK
jgi:hypothetical protein